jgi:hypothetical protein
MEVEERFSVTQSVFCGTDRTDHHAREPRAVSHLALNQERLAFSDIWESISLPFTVEVIAKAKELLRISKIRRI